MQNVGAGNGRRVFWCPKCGTLKTENVGEIESTCGAIDIECPRWTALLVAGKNTQNLLSEVFKGPRGHPFWPQDATQRRMFIPPPNLTEEAQAKRDGREVATRKPGYMGDIVGPGCNPSTE